MCITNLQIVVFAGTNAASRRIVHSERSKSNAVNTVCNFAFDLRGARRSAAVRRGADAQGCVARTFTESMLHACNCTVQLGELDKHPNHDEKNWQRKSHLNGDRAPFTAKERFYETHFVRIPATAALIEVAASMAPPASG